MRYGHADEQRGVDGVQRGSMLTAPLLRDEELTVLVLIMNSVYPAAGEDLEVEPDAHVAVEPPHSFDAQQVVGLPVELRFLPGDPQRGAGEERLRPAARRGEPRRDPQQKAQEKRRGQRPVRRAGRAGHTAEEPLRSGRL